MKKLFLILFLVVGYFANGQILQEPNVYGYKFKRVGSDSLHFIPRDTMQVPTRYNGLSFIANKGGALYYWNGTKWASFSSSGSSYTFTNGITESGGTVSWDSVHVYNELGAKADSLRRSGLAVQMRKNGSWTTQFNLPDSAGGGGDSSFSQITIGDKIKVGTVLNHEWSSGITGWTDNTPSATVTAGTGYVEFSGGGNNYSNAIKYNNTTVSSHDVVLKTDIVVLNKTSTSYGVALSLTPKGNGSSLLVNFMLSDTAGYITTGSFSSRGTSIFKWSANDTLSLEVTRAGRNLICKMTNKANGSVNKLTYPDNMGSVGIPEIYTLGLNFRLVNNYEIIDNSISAPKYIVLGNSIAFGSLSVSESTRWQTFAFDGDGGEVVDLSGPSERALDGWYKVQEIVQRYNPNYVLWCYGVNDLNAATNVDSVRARIERSFDTLLAHGITPIGISGTPQSSNIDPYNTVLQEECTERSLLYVDVTTLLRNGGVGLATQYNYGDNIHLSEAGNEVFGNAVNFALKKEGILKYSSSVDISNLPITDRSDYDVVLDYNNSIALRHRGGDVRSYIKNWPFLSATIKQPGNINLDGTAWLKKAVIGSVPQSGGPTTIDDGGINTNSIYAGYNKFIVTPSAGYIDNLGFIISTGFLYKAVSIPLHFEQQNPELAGGNFFVLRTLTEAPTSHKFLSIVDNTDSIFMIKKGGKVGINTNPDSTLHVNGGLKLVNGTQGAGKVLTSDANGGASWQTPASVADTSYTTIATFNLGGGFASDTAMWVADSTLIGSFYTGQFDYTIAYIQAVIKGNAGDSIVLKLVYNDTFNVDGTKVNGAGLSINNRYTGNVFTISTNRTIAANTWVWLKPEAVITGKKPKYISLTLVGYKTYVAP